MLEELKKQSQIDLEEINKKIDIIEEYNSNKVLEAFIEVGINKTEPPS